MTVQLSSVNRNYTTNKTNFIVHRSTSLYILPFGKQSQHTNPLLKLPLQHRRSTESFSTMVRRLQTEGCSTNGEGVRRGQCRLERERDIIDLTGDDDHDYFLTPPSSRRRINPRTPPEKYQEFSLAQSGSRRAPVCPSPRHPPPPPPPPPVVQRNEPVPEYIPEAPPAPHNDVVVCPQCGYLFIAFLYTTVANMINTPDPVEPFNFDWINDLELGDP
ncbi:hypothetical protein ZOSMA_8G00870 [Zostera marina]|uniref:Uncharacterized protein n=1 Tax=Zostera marina TaxID=29655 RepID=A0A0K9NLH1_ZOSMR|nr:hypothetical protein ZOSMA_8G00870 [Zostera marina]